MHHLEPFFSTFVMLINNDIDSFNNLRENIDTKLYNSGLLDYDKFKHFMENDYNRYGDFFKEKKNRMRLIKCLNKCECVPKEFKNLDESKLYLI